jgi:hypothetical protein
MAEGWVADGLHAVRAMARNMGNCGAANYKGGNSVLECGGGCLLTTGNDTVFPEEYEEWPSPIL